MNAISPTDYVQTPDAGIALQDYPRSLISTLKARSKDTAALGRLPAETIADLEAGSLLSMNTPHQFDGPAVSVCTFLNVVTELGHADAGGAWVTALTNVTTWCAATFFGPEAAEEVFRGAKPARVTGGAK